FDQSKSVFPSEVARGIYIENPPSAEALKLMHLLIGKAGGRMADDVRHDLRLADIKAIEGMRNHSRATLRKLFAELRGAVMIFDDTEAQCEMIGGFLDQASLDYRHEISDDLLIAWWFGRTFRAMAEKSCHWAIMDRQTVFTLSSKYSILLFQHISSLANLSQIARKTFTVLELRAVLGVPDGKMQRWNDVNRFALKPAIAEINQLSRLHLTATPKKVGRTVAEITITWQEKELDQRRETRQELDRPKIGRKARRDGSAETPVLSFPSSGSVKGDRFWDPLAREHVNRLQGGHVPDLRILAESFRSWCAAKDIPLNARAIDKTFIGFCRRYKGLYA
ncbi:replication initiation protein, partial [Ruegeria sp.]|uniref:replication initiation protein n=1 Tax=Ruegeria sp. TaxID=1879320 RepID=UPI003AFFE0CF